MKEEVRISLVQFNSAWLDTNLNTDRIAEFIEAEAREYCSDLIVFPELATTGYVRSHLLDAEFPGKFYERSEPIPGPSTERFGKVAKEYETYVVVGISQLHPTIPGVLYNSAALISPDGNVAAVYHKAHASIDEKNYFVAGNSVGVHDVSFGRIGLNICYDARFPELARVQALQGAELIISIWATWTEAGKTSADSLPLRCRMRAKENALYYIGCNRAGQEGDRVFSGRSIIAGPSGEVLACSTGDSEEVIRATVTATALKDRQDTTSYLADRRPELYAALRNRL